VGELGLTAGEPCSQFESRSAPAGPEDSCSRLFFDCVPDTYAHTGVQACARLWLERGRR